MTSLSNFNSVLQIGFAVNALLYFFDLKQALEDYFKNKTLKLGDSEISWHLDEKDRNFISSYGWRALAFGYVIWMSRLKTLTVLDSILSLCLLIFSGFNPTFEIGNFFIFAMLLVLFIPVTFITLVIIYGLPFYKLSCMKNATKKILERDRQTIGEDEYTKREERFDVLIKFIEFRSFPLIYSLKNIRNKEATNFDLLFNDIENKS
jgi:hypothetical protein